MMTETNVQHAGALRQPAASPAAHAHGEALREHGGAGRGSVPAPVLWVGHAFVLERLDVVKLPDTWRAAVGGPHLERGSPVQARQRVICRSSSKARETSVKKKEDNEDAQKAKNNPQTQQRIRQRGW